MSSLEPPDSFHLSAATGWLELGNHVEAGQELAGISAACHEHPDVLEVRWAICAAGNDWEGGLSAAELLLKKAPKRSSGWLHRAYALRRVKRGGLQQAWEALRPAFEKFPKEPVIPYNLACYACQKGLLAEAREWLQRAVKIAGRENIRSMALNDEDLQQLWEEIKGM